MHGLAHLIFENDWIEGGVWEHDAFSVDGFVLEGLVACIRYPALKHGIVTELAVS